MTSPLREHGTTPNIITEGSKTLFAYNFYLNYILYILYCTLYKRVVKFFLAPNFSYHQQPVLANAYNPNIGGEEKEHREPREILREIERGKQDLIKQLQRIGSILKG